MKKLFVSLTIIVVAVSAYAQTAAQQAINKALINASKGKENKTAITKTALSDGEVPKIIVNSSGEAFILKTRTVDIKDEGGESIFAINENTIFPGAIVYADKNLADGRPVLVGLPYGKVDLTINFNTGGSTIAKGVRNDLGSVRTAIFSILDSMKGTYAPPVTFSSKEKSYTSTSKMCLDLKMSASYLTNTVNMSANTTNNESKVVKMQDFTQKYYTVSITPYMDDELYKYFGSNVTEQQIQDKYSDGRPIAVIVSVSYGRRIYYFEEFYSSDFSFTGNESAKVSVGGVSVSGSSAQSITKSSTATNKILKVLGGSTKPAQDVANGMTPQQAFAKEGTLSLNSSNQGIPIWFEAQFLVNHAPVIAQATGSYTESTYVKCPQTVRFEIKNRANTAGDCVKFKGMYNVIEVTGNSEKGYKYEIIKGDGTGEGAYADYFENVYSNKTQKTRTIPTNDIEKCKNKKGNQVKKSRCYVIGPVHYTIRSKTADVKGVKWHQDEEGDFDISGGSVRVYMNGSALKGGKGVYIHSDTKPLPIGK